MLKAASPEERIQMRKELLKTLLGKLINNQQEIKRRQFTQELDIVLKKIKKGMLPASTKYLMEDKEIR